MSWEDSLTVSVEPNKICTGYKAACENLFGLSQEPIVLSKLALSFFVVV